MAWGFAHGGISPRYERGRGREPTLLKGHTRCTLTPNVAEFSRLCGAVLPVESDGTTEQAPLLARELGVTIVQKGADDIIADNGALVCTVYNGQLLLIVMHTFFGASHREFRQMFGARHATSLWRSR